MRGAGAIRKANVGISNDNAGEKPAREEAIRSGLVAQVVRALH